jgi:hypothetical protein
METLREGWTEYEQKVLPDDFGQGARDIVHHAFYHGAIALLAIGAAIQQRGGTDAERDAFLLNIVDEITEFDADCQTKLLMHALAGMAR